MSLFTWEPGTTHFKPSAMESRNARIKSKTEKTNHETREKAKVRKRDKRCRFPDCGCRGLRMEVAHIVAKSLLDPSDSSGMIFLCVQRHQDGVISLHHKTLRIAYLTDQRANGPIAFEIDASYVAPKEGEPRQPTGTWIELARERSIGVLEKLTPIQAALVARLGWMDL